MATHDYVIDNQSAPALRSDLNNVLQAIVSQNSSAAAPTTTYADMIWYDTAANQLKKRNEANSAWITLGTVDEVGGTFTPNALITTSQIDPTTLVTASETIASNNNDTTIPTSAAVKSYTDTALAGAASVTFLGTISTASGSTVTLSGLNLTSYKFLQCFLSSVSINNSTGGAVYITSFIGGRIVAQSGSSTRSLNGGIIVDLATGVFSASSSHGGSLSDSFAIGGSSGLTTASTSVSFIGAAGAGFNGGSIRVYGVK